MKRLLLSILLLAIFQQVNSQVSTKSTVLPGCSDTFGLYYNNFGYTGSNTNTGSGSYTTSGCTNTQTETTLHYSGSGTNTETRSFISSSSSDFYIDHNYSGTPISTLTYTFSNPVKLNNLVIGDIDRSSHYVDVVTVSADAPLTITTGFSTLNINNQVITAIGGTANTNAFVNVSSNSPITTLTITYTDTNPTSGNRFIYIKNGTSFCCSTYSCLAGNTAPSLSADYGTANNNSTFNLNSVTANNTPANTLFKWYTSPSLVSQVQPLNVGVGTYYAAFYDYVNDCFSPPKEFKVLLDTDGDTVADIHDLDDDNDGILDTEEQLFCSVPNLPQGAISGFGNYKKQLLFFHWGTQTLSNGVCSSKTVNGVTYKATISNFSVSNGSAHFTGHDMNTWSAAGIQKLYNKTYYNEGFFNASANSSSSNTILKAKVTITATKNGVPFYTGFSIVPFDMETTNLNQEYTKFTTNGDNFEFLENNGVNPSVSGVGTKTINYTNTQGTVINGSFYANSLYFSRNATYIEVEQKLSNSKQGFGVALRLFCDTDGDGIPNSLDLDSDDDGISDLIESGNSTAINLDTNNDGFISASESAVGNNGVANDIETFIDSGIVTAPVDSDNDGIIDANDLDSDNDGIHDLTEGLPIGGNLTGLDANNSGVLDSTTDVDNDGIMDSIDTNTSAIGGLTNITPDTDSDGIKDFRDLDTDNDGITDIKEGGNGHLDINNNGKVDYITDSDGDGIADALDNNNGVFGSFDPTLPNADNDNNPVIPDFRDLDSDNDGINDVEEAYGGVDIDGDGQKDNPNILISNPGTAYVIVNGTQITGVDADNDGIIDSEDGLLNEFGDARFVNNVMITQVYHKDNSVKAIEITNYGNQSIPANLIKVVLYKNNASTNGVPTETYTLSDILPAGYSAVFRTSTGGSLNTIGNNIIKTTNSVTDFEGGNDIIALSRVTNTNAWANRYDVVNNFKNNSSLVRIDYVNKPNKNYTPSEWVVFINDAIPAYGDNTSVAINTNTQRHQHAPLLSEVTSPVSETNAGLGLHRIGTTTVISNVWNNGYPDRSRHAIINEDYVHTVNSFNARRIEVNGNSKFSVANQLTKITDSVTIADNAQIRMIGKSQFIQTHSGSGNIIGNGKLLIDQHSNINVAEGIYRYNYWSSPVVEVGKTTYTVGSVMKDGTTPLSSNSTLTDINFTSSTYNGSVGNPITLANYWIWTFYNSTSRENWHQAKNTGSIDRGKGYTMKGTGYVGSTGQNYTFVGTPNDGEFSYTMNAHTTSLMGNPYPGSIDTNTFIKENEGTIHGELYFWEHTGATDIGSYVEQHGKTKYQGGYSMRNLAMGVSANNLTLNSNHQIAGQTIGTGSGTYHEPTRYVAKAQGFFVCAHSQGTLKFTNKQRAIDNINDVPFFFKTSKKKKANTSKLPILKLGFEYFNKNNLGIHRQIGISFKKENSFKFDYGFDSEMLDIQETEIYFEFPTIKKKLVVTGVQEISNDLEVPVTLKINTDKSVFVMIDVKENIDNYVYLTDKVTGTIYSLEKPAEISLPKGVYTDRFFVTFSQDRLSIKDDKLLSNKVAITLNNSVKELTIVKSDLTINSVELYNLLGQKTANWVVKENTDTKRYNLSNIKRGVYIVKVLSNKGTISKKILHF